VTTYRKEADAAGWKPTPDQMVHRNHIVVAETAREAAELEASFLPAINRKSIAANMRANRVASGLDAVMNEWATRLESGKLMFAGTPDVIVERIEAFYEETGVGVLDFLFAAGLTPPAAVRRSIELFGTEVLPRVRHIGAPTPVLSF
jgi:alkanesulfonate monooxygenase SsuD/methylene tetrahydromethanopterin reductase-like flavin-dependent oxidoreductase (luciferase family)